MLVFLLKCPIKTSLSQLWTLLMSFSLSWHVARAHSLEGTERQELILKFLSQGYQANRTADYAKHTTTDKQLELNANTTACLSWSDDEVHAL